MSQLSAKNASVLGISADSVESHKRFVEKEHLNFPLLADTDKKMITEYGVLSPAGYANRVTFVVGPDSKIREIDRAVNAQFNRDGTTLTTRHGSNLALLLSDWKAQVGQPVPNFSVLSTEGHSISLAPAGKKATVVIFLGAHSPRSAAYAQRLADLAADPAYKDVAFLGLFPNAADDDQAIKSFAAKQPLSFPLARDPDNRLADHFGARVTPEVWVVNSKGIAVYNGAVDDNPDAARASVRYLKEALDQTLANKPLSLTPTRATGDPIKRARK
jgi:peroxiredoxin